MAEGPPYPGSHVDAIGWIGLGAMGSAMAQRLVGAGYPLVVYARSEEARATARHLPASVLPSPCDVAEASRVIFTMVSTPDDVREIYLGQGGLLSLELRGSILIDMSTSAPALAQEVAEAASRQGAQAIDAPVSGGPTGAREGTLSIMVGGDPDAIRAVQPLLEVLGGIIVRQGGAGAGQSAKLANQVALAGSMLGICEAFVFAREAGLDERCVLESLTGGIAGSPLTRFIWQRLADDEMHSGFSVALMIKDLRLVSDSAALSGLTLPGVRLALELYEAAVDAGFGGGGSQVLVAGLDQTRRWTA